MLQAKAGEAREASGGELADALRAAVADNERLNKQLHVLHGNATQLRQAIADARSLQMHLQQEAADASGLRHPSFLRFLLPNGDHVRPDSRHRLGSSTAGLLAVGLQAQLRDAEAHAGEAEADRKGVRTAGLQLVRDTVTMFQLTATEVFGSATLAFAQQQVSMLGSMQVITRAYRALAPECVASYARRLLALCHQ